MHSALPVKLCSLLSACLLQSRVVVCHPDEGGIYGWCCEQWPSAVVLFLIFAFCSVHRCLLRRHDKQMTDGIAGRLLCEVNCLVQRRVTGKDAALIPSLRIRCLAASLREKKPSSDQNPERSVATDVQSMFCRRWLKRKSFHHSGYQRPLL